MNLGLGLGFRLGSGLGLVSWVGNFSTTSADTGFRKISKIVPILVDFVNFDF